MFIKWFLKVNGQQNVWLVTSLTKKEYSKLLERITSGKLSELIPVSWQQAPYGVVSGAGCYRTVNTTVSRESLNEYKLSLVAIHDRETHCDAFACQPG